MEFIQAYYRRRSPEKALQLIEEMRTMTAQQQVVEGLFNKHQLLYGT